MESNCSISIEPEISRADEAVNIKISGLSKNQRVTIRALSNDYYSINTSIFDIGRNAKWESYGVFEADEFGNIDLEKSKPIEGTYINSNGMGLFYSMVVKEKCKTEVPKKLNDIDENRSCTFMFQVESNGKIITSKTHKRIFCDERIKSCNVVEEKLLARYFTSEEDTPKPAVIVLSGSDGRIEKAQCIAELLAMQGYSALAVCYFGLEGTKESLNCIELECVENAISWLKKQSTVDKDKIAIYGRSKGGEMVLLAASMFRDISCVVANTPSCYVYEGLKTNKFPSKHSSWMYKGKEIPFVKFSFPIIFRMGIKMCLKQKGAMAWMYKKLFEKGVTDEVTIPVNKISGPVLLISSEKDEIWPSKMHSEIAMELLKKANFKYEYKHITYENSGHMLTVPYQTEYPETKYPKDIDSFAEANIQCWRETLNFLEKWKSK